MRWLVTPDYVRKPDWFRRRAGSSHGRRTSLERCCKVTEEVYNRSSTSSITQRVMLEGIILKPNMVLPGLTCTEQETVEEVADATVKCLLRAVPAAVPGLPFVGGQSSELASARLNAMNVRFKSTVCLWALAFSFARAIQTTRVGDLER